MKTRKGFVSNSSSCSFLITNTSNKKLTLLDFVKENTQLVQEFNDGYDYNHTQEDMIACAEARCASEEYIYNPGVPTKEAFGDNDGDVLGQVFDYILRNGGTSDNFVWSFVEYLR